MKHKIAKKKTPQIFAEQKETVRQQPVEGLPRSILQSIKRNEGR